MKNRKSSKLLALGLVFALGLGLSTAFAAVSRHHKGDCGR